LTIGKPSATIPESSSFSSSFIVRTVLSLGNRPACLPRFSGLPRAILRVVQSGRARRSPLNERRSPQ
jgi:hypothetical protein